MVNHEHQTREKSPLNQSIFNSLPRRCAHPGWVKDQGPRQRRRFFFRSTVCAAHVPSGFLCLNDRTRRHRIELSARPPVLLPALQHASTAPFWSKKINNSALLPIRQRLVALRLRRDLGLETTLLEVRLVALRQRDDLLLLFSLTLPMSCLAMSCFFAASRDAWESADSSSFKFIRIPLISQRLV